MKRLMIAVLSLGLLASLASAQLLIGARPGGMGGAGVANSDDLSAVYYNPAGLMRSKVNAAELKISLGAAYTDPTALSSAISKATDPATFLTDNYGTDLAFDGSVDGVIGVNIRKIGISVLPIGNADVSKPADSLVGTVETSGSYAAVVTLGHTFSLPFLPAALDLGLNIKSLTAYTGAITTTGTPTSAAGTRTYSSGTGTGYDVGVLTSFEVPWVSTLKVGAVARDLGQTVNYSNKSQTSTLTYDLVTQSPTVTTGPEVSLADTSVTANPVYAAGVSATVPGINLALAADLERTAGKYNTHLGAEYPLLMNLLILRAGSATGDNLSKTTIGAKINLPILTLDAVAITDANNSTATSYLVDINLGW